MDANENTSQAIYEIRLRARLESRWAAWFDEMQLIPLEDGGTLLRGSVIDQSALHGLLEKIRNLNLPLVSVNRVE